MAVVYYDNLEVTPTDDTPGFVEVERVYCFDWDQFSASHWEELSLIYMSLPGAVRYLDMPWWFGEDEELPPFLSASVEPPGLQVYGVLPNVNWQAWDERFRFSAGELPMRVLR